MGTWFQFFGFVLIALASFFGFRVGTMHWAELSLPLGLIESGELIDKMTTIAGWAVFFSGLVPGGIFIGLGRIMNRLDSVGTAERPAVAPASHEPAKENDAPVKSTAGEIVVAAIAGAVLIGGAIGVAYLIKPNPQQSVRDSGRAVASARGNDLKSAQDMLEEFERTHPKR